MSTLKNIQGKNIRSYANNAPNATAGEMWYNQSELKLIGVSEIHVRIPAPPVIDICQLGIAIHSKEELLLNNKSISDVCTLLSIDSLEYLLDNGITKTMNKFN